MFCESDNVAQDGHARESLAAFMLAQIQSMEKFRQTLAHRTGNEISTLLKITSRVSRSNSIVPFRARGMIFEVQGFHFFSLDFDALGIFLFNQSRLHLEPRRGCGLTNRV